MIRLSLMLFCFCSGNLLAGSPAEDAYAQVKQGSAVLVDVREAREAQDGMIERAVLFPTSRFDGEENWKPEFKKISDEKAIFLYCRSGKRSEKIRGILRSHGIESVNLGAYDDLRKVLPTTVGLK